MLPCRAPNTLLALALGAATMVGCQQAKPDEAPKTSEAAAEEQKAPEGMLAWEDRAMGRARAIHSSTRLDDGRVLVAGGIINRQRDRAKKGEVYDPDTGEWTETGPLVQPRSNGVLTALGDGRALLTGGLTLKRKFMNDAEIYDPKTNAWTSIAPMPTARYGHSATPLPNGRVLVVGGMHLKEREDQRRPEPVTLASALIYNPKTDEWSETAALDSPRFGHGAVVLDDSSVLVAGGVSGMGRDERKPLDEAVLFDIAAETWQKVAPAPEPVVAPKLSRLDEGRAMLVDLTDLGQKTQIYDASANAWTKVGAPAAAKMLARDAALPDGPLLQLDAWTVVVFDPAKEAWFELPALERGRRGVAIERTGPDSVLIAAGVGLERNMLGRSVHLVRVPADQVEPAEEPTVVELPAEGKTIELHRAIWEQVDGEKGRGCGLFWGPAAEHLLRETTRPILLKGADVELRARIACGKHAYNAAFDRLQFRQALMVGYEDGQAVAAHPSDISYTKPISEMRSASSNLNPFDQITVLGMFEASPKTGIELDQLLSDMKTIEPHFTVVTMSIDFREFEDR